MRSFIGWIGGKSRLAPEIVKRFPEHKTYVEVFGGAGWVLFSKEPSKVEVWNDLNGFLVNLFRVVKHRPAELVERLNLVLYSHETFKKLKKQWKEGLDGDEMERAASFLYLVRSAFGAKEGGDWAYGKTSAPRTVIDLDFMFKIQARLKRVYIDNRSWEKVITAFDAPETLFYLDPPYWLPGKKFYKHEFNFEAHQALCARLSGIKGKFVLSYNNSREVWKWYKGFKILSTRAIHYPMRNLRGKSLKKTELIIRNF